MDDILIATHNDLPLHRQITHQLLDILEQESFFLKPSKCLFEQSSIEYLGIVIDGTSLWIDPVKIQGITEWPRNIKNVSDLRTTLGILGYHRPFIQGFAQLAKPLTTLLKKDTPFLWTDECRDALN